MKNLQYNLSYTEYQKIGYQKSAKPDVPHGMYTTIKEQVFPLGN